MDKGGSADNLWRKEKVRNSYLGKWESEFAKEMWQNHLMVLGAHLKFVAISLK